jgi:hypothetical protein
MIARALLVLFMAVTSLTVTISPVVAKVAFAQENCAAISLDTDSSAMAMDAHHDHHGPATAPDTPGNAETGTLCCDHVCVFDLTLAPRDARIGQAETRMSRAWPAIDRLDQSGPLGLQRPPKA